MTHSTLPAKPHGTMCSCSNIPKKTLSSAVVTVCVSLVAGKRLDDVPPLPLCGMQDHEIPTQSKSPMSPASAMSCAKTVLSVVVPSLPYTCVLREQPGKSLITVVKDN